MVGRLKLAIPLLLMALVAAPVALQAQDGGRYRVLIPDFEPREGADDDFGKDVADDLRELLSESLTHVAIEEDEIKDDLKRFKMKMEELDCIRTRQLASQMNAQVALCASYVERDDDRVLEASFWDVASGEDLQVESITVNRRERERAAQHIFDSFDLYVQQVRAIGICQDYYASQQYENALRNCDQALELNPDHTATRYLRGRILYEMEDYAGALAELETVLAENPYHDDALQLAGYIAASEGQDEDAREYYGRYLEMNPDNATIRMNIAYDLAQAGDPIGAMQFIQVGLDVDPENVDLLEQYGGFAFAGALKLVQEHQMGATSEDAETIPPAALELYRQAIDAYTKVFDQKGADTRVGHLRNIMAAYLQLDEPEEAVAIGTRVLETHPQEDGLWSVYADALQRAGRLDDAITALDRVRELNPEHPNAALRQGNWLIQAGQIERAVELLTEVAQAGPERATQAANMIFGDAYNNGVQKGNYGYALRGLVAAKALPNLSQGMQNQLNFWHGYSLYQQAEAEEKPQTLQTARATLPKFQQALRLFAPASVGGYPATVNVNMTQLREATQTYIEIQEAIIKRGG